MGPASVPGDAEAAAVSDELILPSDRGMKPSERLEVYREQFWLRHLSNLSDDFPTLIWAIGGAAAFHDLARDYLQAHPPTTWDLQRLGAALPAHVANKAPWHGDDLARDAARLDWAFMEAFDAADAGPLDPHRLAAISESAWPLATIVFHPSLRALALDYPVHDVREALRHGTDSARPNATKSHVVVWRDRACALRATSIEPAAWRVLGALACGTPLGQACEAVAHDRDAGEAAELAPRLSKWFQEWSANGWVSAVLPHARVTGRPKAGRDAGGS